MKLLYSFTNNPVTDVYCAGKTSACSRGHLPQMYCSRSCNASWAALRADPTSLPNPVHAQGKIGLDISDRDLLGGTSSPPGDPGVLGSQSPGVGISPAAAPGLGTAHGHWELASRTSICSSPCPLQDATGVGSPCDRVRIRGGPDAHAVCSASQQDAPHDMCLCQRPSQPSRSAREGKLQRMCIFRPERPSLNIA